LQVATEGKVVCGSKSSIANDLRGVMKKIDRIWKINKGG